MNYENVKKCMKMEVCCPSRTCRLYYISSKILLFPRSACVPLGGLLRSLLQRLLEALIQRLHYLPLITNQSLKLLVTKKLIFL